VAVKDLVQVYPNPARSRMTVEGDHIEKIELFNTLGQRLASIRGNGELKQTVSLNAYPAGVYLLKMHVNRQVVVKNIIITD
jgi:hypothetical protein